MVKIKNYLKSLIVGLPIVTIVVASFLPLRSAGYQFLVLGALLWFMTYILFEVFAR